MLMHRHVSTSPRIVLLLVCAALAAAGTFAVVRATSSVPVSPRQSGALGPDSTFTLEQPLPVPGAKQVSMSDAEAAFGGPIALPNTAQASPSDVGVVWMARGRGDAKGETQTTVRVTFPSEGLIVAYERPAIPDPLAFIQQSVKDIPATHMIYLSGVPAWVLPELPDDPLSWDSIEFVTGGATVFLFSHTGVASLQPVAQSIIDRATAAG